MAGINIPTVLPLSVSSDHPGIKATLRIDHRVQWEVYLSGWLPDDDLETRPLVISIPSFDSTGTIRLTCYALPFRGGMTNESGRSFRYAWSTPAAWPRQAPEIFIHWLPKPAPIFRQTVIEPETSSDEDEAHSMESDEAPSVDVDEKPARKWTRWF